MPTHTDVVAADGRKRYRGLYLNVAAAFGPPAEFPATHLRHRSHLCTGAKWARPSHVCTGTKWARPSHVCIGTRLAPPTSAPGLGCAKVPACDGLGVPGERKVGADPERRELHNGTEKTPRH
jgi:hypothetical protein